MQHNASPPARRDQLARSAALVVLFAVPAIFCLHAAVVADPDVWWHLRAGEWILQHHAFPHTDPFSAYGAGRSWMAYSWLFEVTLFRLFARWDLLGIVAYTTAMISLITMAVYRLIARHQSDFIKAALLTLAVMVTLNRLYTPRPWLVTILFFTLEMDILMRARTSGRRRGLLLLPLLFAVWANVHIQFVNGLLVLGVAACEPILDRWWKPAVSRLSAPVLWTVLCASILGTLLNPYGWRIYQTAFELSSQAGVLDRVTELHAIQFRGAGDFLFLFLVLAAVAALAYSRSFPFFETALLLVAALVSFRSQRDVWFMSIIAAAVLAPRLPGRQDAKVRLSWMAVPVSACAVALVLFGAARVFRLNHSLLQKQVAESLPVNAVESVEQRQWNGPVYNDYTWGGYLIWTLRRPVTIDGRAALHGDARIERSMATWNAEPGWADDPDLRAAGYVVAPIKTPLAQVLRLDPRFALEYEDKTAAVFVNRQLNPTAEGLTAARASLH